MEYEDWGLLLEKRFPPRDPAEDELQWATLKQRQAVGESVTGVVVARAPFGAWIDFGVGFPALLEIICIAGLTPERYRAGDWCLVGSEITTFVVGFDDRLHQIRLIQVQPGEQRQPRSTSSG